jgi:hypothetical protein
MSQAQRTKPKLGETSTPGSTRKKGPPSGKTLPGMGAKRRSIGGRSSAIARELFSLRSLNAQYEIQLLT